MKLSKTNLVTKEDIMKKKKITIAVCIVLVLAVIVSIAIIMKSTRKDGIDNNPETSVSGQNNTLVAYFSWSGNVQQMARWIADETKSDIFRIVPEEDYGENFDDCADRAKNELDNGIRPSLSEHIDKETIDKYDTIYIGFPVWWYDLPMPVWTFLEEYDLSEKTIIPFFRIMAVPTVQAVWIQFQNLLLIQKCLIMMLFQFVAVILLILKVWSGNEQRNFQ